MKNKKVIILIILSIGAVISLIYGITVRPRGRRISRRSEVITHTGAIPSGIKIIPTKRRAEKTDFVSWKRNPFVPEGVPGPKPARLALNGILWDEKNPAAIINDDIVSIGAKVDGNEVIDIKPDRVILNDGTKNFELGLGQD